MSNTIKAGDFGEALNDLLTRYGDKARNAIQEEVIDIAKEASKKLKSAGRQFLQPLMRKVNQLKRQKAGHVVAALLLSKQNALQLIKVNGLFIVQKLKVNRPKTC